MSSTAKPQRLSLRDILTDPRIGIMLLLGFSAGLPIILVFGTLSAWLRTAGISRTSIGLLSYVALAYSFKFVWAPLVDRYDVPVLSRLLGRRRAWMAVSQIVCALGLLAISTGDPATSLMPIVMAALVVAFASATQDVVIDGWRIDVAPTARQGMMAAAYQLAYRLALICSGAGALYIADFVSWSAAYQAMAALMGVGLLGTFLAPRIDETATRERFSFTKAFVEPFADLVRRKGLMLVPILLLVALFRLPDFVAGVMANPLYIDLKFSLSDIANVTKIYGVWIGIAGAFAGGWALTRLGLWWTLVIGSTLAAGSNLMFAWLAHVGNDLLLLTFSISIDNFAGGFAGSALIAYMSGLTSPGFAATQYALLSSLYALPGKLIGGVSGAVVDTWGYPALFTGTAAIGIPLLVLCMIVRRDTVDAENRPTAEDADAVPAGG